jgi:ABC-2 type transport system ATP-binding protein
VSQPTLVVDRVSRSFGKGARRVHALRDVSFTIDPGEVVGLLGANGAGKTTLTKIAATLLLPSSGTVLVHGADAVARPREARRLTSVVFGGDRGLYPRLSGVDNLRFFAMLGGASRRELAARADAALAEAGLSDAAGRAVETYSRGMRQRLHLTIGMFTRPRLLLLDEPTVGLDPLEAERLRAVIARLRAGAVSVLLTSHYLLDIERLANRVVLLAGGAVSGDMPVTRFANTAGYVSTVTVRARGVPPAGSPPSSAQAGLLVDDWQVDGDICTARLRVKDWRAESFGELSGLLGTLFGTLEVLDVRVDPIRLEDVYAQFHHEST